MRVWVILSCLLSQALSQTQEPTLSPSTTVEAPSITVETPSTTQKTSITTSKVPSTTQKTAERKTSVTPFFNRTEFRYGYYCTCDLTSNYCDLNCCCDPDCKSNDVDTFTGCHHVDGYETDPRYCHHSEIVVKNNTQYVIKKSNDKFGNVLFCVATDNLEDHRRFLDQPLVENSTEFDIILSKHQTFNSFSKNRLESDLEGPFEADNYKVGSPIWTMDNITEDLGILILPSKLNEIFCHSPQAVR